MGRNPVNNVKVNELSEGRNINVNKDNAFAGTYDRYKQKRKRSNKDSRSALSHIRRSQRIADDLVRKFGPRAEGSYSYFCKCANLLPESVIWDCYESACKPNVINKLAYFLAVTKAQPQMV